MPFKREIQLSLGEASLLGFPYPVGDLAPLVRALWNARSSVFPHRIDWTGDWMVKLRKPIEVLPELGELSAEDEWWNSSPPVVGAGQEEVRISISVGEC